MFRRFVKTVNNSSQINGKKQTQSLRASVKILLMLMNIHEKYSDKGKDKYSYRLTGQQHHQVEGKGHSLIH